jgi:hypothetical protein
MRSFIKKISLFTLVLYVAGAAMFMTLFKDYYLAVVPLLPLFFVLIKITGYTYIEFLSKRRHQRFITGYMALTAVRMMIYLVGIIIYVFSFKAQAVVFLITFMVLYLAYTVFEVVVVLKFLKQSKL